MKDKTFNIIVNITSIECIICGIIMYFLQPYINEITNIDINNLSKFCIIYGISISFFANIYRLTEIHEEKEKEKRK